jgi:putative ABC transport system permease protein
LLVALVAFIGIVNTLMSLMLERNREIGILRANGMTNKQLWRTALTECGLIGAIAGVLAIPLGTVLAWILIFIINKRSFGWSAGFEFAPEQYFMALVISISAAVLAGIYPVYAACREKIADALRME